MTGKVAVYWVLYEVVSPHFQVLLVDASTVNFPSTMFGIPAARGKGQET